MVAFVRTVKTAPGATAMQLMWSWRRGSRSIEHLGSAHDEVELAALKAAAAARLTAGQTELDLAACSQLMSPIDLYPCCRSIVVRVGDRVIIGRSQPQRQILTDLSINMAY